MPLLKSIMDSIFPKSGVRLQIAYYVAETGQQKTISRKGIPLSADGKVHVFGNLSCAMTKRDILEAQGITCCIFKIECNSGKSEIDPSGEDVSQKAPGDHDEMCHAFMMTTPIIPECIIGVVDYL
jgi:hypothetical protein